MSCPVCCEKINKSVRKPVECEFCQFSCCRVCAKTYLLQANDDPHCMQCRRRWNRESMCSKFDKTFFNGEYKKHREQVLFERELALMPATQPIVEKIAERRRIEEEIARLRHELWKKKEELDSAKRHTARDTRPVLSACPVNDCRGFLKEDYTCGICLARVCKKCMLVRADEHKCDEEAVANLRAIRSETRPCPKCAVRIYKIEGCDQMFCVQCHTAFSWKTGRVETGAVHNPHFFEWVQKGGRAPQPRDEDMCAVLDHMFVAEIQHDRRVPAIWARRMRGIIHTREVVLAERRELTNQDLRIRYLLNEISQDALRVALQRQEKKRERDRDVRDILTMFVQTATDLFLEKAKTFRELEDPELSRLVEYCNECLRKNAKMYDCLSFMQIDPKTFIPQ